MWAESSDHYAFETVGDRIHAAIASPGGTGVCNSGLVDLGDGILLFDTGLTPSSAVDLGNGSEARLGGRPSLVAISHWHLDHSNGNQSFPRVPIWGTRRTREIMLEMKPQIEAELTREALAAERKLLEKRRSAMKTEHTRADFELWIRINEALLSAAGEIRITPPDQTFESRLALPGDRDAELISFGAAHTDADAMLFLPREKILFGGDVLTLELQPSMGSGNPEHWLEVLNDIERLRPERIVPGHGPVSPADAVEDVRAYLTAVMKAAEGRKGTSLPAAIRKWDGSIGLEENLKFAREWIKKRRPRK